MKKLKITFIVPNINLSGGVKAVLEFSNHLIDMGHDVTVVYPTIPMRGGASWFHPGLMLGRGKAIAKKINADNPIDWFDYRGKLLRTTTLAEKYIPKGDAVIATWWETAYHVAAYNENKGEKFYLIQHHEIWGGQKERVEKTYRLGLANIVNSTWLKDIIEKDLDSPVHALILHAPDLQQCYSEEIERPAGLRILMPYRDIEWKGVDDGLTAFAIAKEKHPEVQLVLFGPEPKPGSNIPKDAEFHITPYGDALRNVYNSCDIFIFPSHVEGFGMPPMEAMACSCAVATTNVGAVPDYAIAGVTALVSPPREPELLAENLVLLIEDKELRKSVTEAGREHIVKNFNWANAAIELEKVIQRRVAKRSL
ncbi:hypothetical protein MNBD_DELTA01-1971 [hydrothermal vent metagenome]|uniref:Glycosyl transferase family 1 domain-containing protein n=1 Tax=hydrothermal vent metagenome TaxID=652676 RepID=A0A3B0RQB9_9ZZZZ